MLHRPLRRPLAIVLLLCLVDYGLWNWSLGASHDLIALAAGLTLIPLLIALAWLVLVSATRLAGATTRRVRASTAARTGSAGRRGGGSAASVAGAPRNGASRKTAEPPSARERRTAPSAGDGEAAAATAASSSKLAA